MRSQSRMLARMPFSHRALYLAPIRGPIIAPSVPPFIVPFIVIVLLLAGSASAAPVGPTRGGASTATTATVVAPTAPPPNVALTVEAPSIHARWRLRVVNNDAVPLRLTADARLLRLDVLPPGAAAAQTLHCALPDDMRPTNDVDRALVVPPRRAYAETFDPRLYCFGAKESAAFLPGSTIVAHFGWATPVSAPTRGHTPRRPPSPPSPPFLVSGFEGVVPAVSPLKEIVSAPFVIPADPSPPPGTVATVAGGGNGVGVDAFPTKLALTTPATMDAWGASDLAIPVTVKNLGTRAVTLLYRHETIGFDLIGPAGVFRCVWPTRPPAPIREMYTTLPPGRHDGQSVILSDICPEHTFDQPGLFVVRPRLDTRAASGDSIGLRTFDGEVFGITTTVLRIHHGTEVTRPERPRLE